MKNVELLTFTFLSLMFWSIGEVLSLFFTNFSQKTMPQFAGAWEKLLKDVKKARKENGKSRLSSSKTFSHRRLVRTFLHFWPPKYYSGHGSESEKLNHYDQILPREYVLIVMHSTFNVCSKHSSNTLLRLLRIFMRQTLYTTVLTVFDLLQAQILIQISGDNAFKSWWGHQFMVDMICPPSQLGQKFPSIVSQNWMGYDY